MFTTFIVQPIFNLLVLIYALIPGHNLGLSLIVFTILIRLLMWPLVKKQLHHAKAMRELQPEIKRIKAQTKGNRQQESLLMMELYKEKQVNPFSSLGILVVQIPILIGLFSGIHKIINNPHALIDFSYEPIRNLGWMQKLAGDINLLDNTLINLVDLTRAALDKAGGVYWPAMIIVVAGAIMQYYQSKQLLPQDKEQRSLRAILKEASSGKQSDSSEVNAAVGRSTRWLLPAMIFIFTVNIASALSLYFLTSGIVAYIQQAKILNQDKEEMQTVATGAGKKRVIEGEVVEKKAKKTSVKNRSKKHKRRKN